MKIAAAQTPVCRDPCENGVVIRAQMREASDKGARLVQFTEGALSGYALNDQERTEWERVGSELEQVTSLARELKLWTVLGSGHRLDGRRPYNSLYVISDAGEIAARYDKRLCSHNEIYNFFSPGFQPCVFEADEFRFGLTLCLEVCFPELFMEYERLGVDCVLLSAHSGDPMFGVMAQGHAAANCYWMSVSTPARAGALPTGAIGPDGFWMAQSAEQAAPAVVVAEFDRTDPRFDIPLSKARPWRRSAREGKIYRERQEKPPGRG
jgi:predicted amidohydrolase